MRLISLDLRNIKSYGSGGCHVSFKPGVNLIWGENGSGKTTILEAIGFALFGALELDIKQFRRKGENESEVTLTLEGNDERLYRVVRKIKASADLEIRDQEDGRKISKTKEDAQRWLTETAGVEFAGFGRTLFENVLGVSQGRMVESFLQTPAVRKTIFEPVLRLEGYDRARDHLGKLNTELNDRISEARRSEARLGGRLEALPGVRAALEGLRQQIAHNTTALTAVQQQLSAQESEFLALDSLRSSLEDLEHQVAMAQGKVEQAEQQARTAETLWNEAQTAAQVVETSRGGYQAYVQAQEQQLVLEQNQRQRDGMNRAMKKTEARLGELSVLLEQIQAQLHGVEAAEQRIQALQPDVDRQQQLENALDQARQEVDQRERALKEIAKLQRKEQDLQATLQKVNADLQLREKTSTALTGRQTERAALLAALETLTQEVNLTRKAHEKARADWHALQMEEKTLKDWQARFQEISVEIEKNQDELQKMVDDLATRAQVQQEAASLLQKQEAEQTRLNTAQNSQDHANQRIQEIEERLAMLGQADTAECPVCKKPLNAHEAGEIKQEFDDEIASLKQQIETARREEESARKNIKRLKVDLKQASARLEGLPTPDQQARLSASITERQSRLSAIQTQIDERSALPEKLAAQQQLVQTCKEHLAEREGRLNELQKSRESADDEISKLNQKLSRLPQPVRAAELAAEIKTCQEEQAALQQRSQQLAHAPETLEKTQTALTELGNPREEQARQRGIAQQRPNLELNQSRQRQEQQEQQARLKVQQDALRVHDGLDQEIQAVKDCLSRAKADYMAYLSHEKAAQALEQRQQSLAQARAQQVSMQQAFAERTAQRDQAKQSFDRPRYESLYKEREQNKREKVRLETLITSLQGQENQKDNELTDLFEVERLHQLAAQELARLEKLSSTLAFVRESIHRAGPLVARRRVQAISYSANRIYRYILTSSNDHRAGAPYGSDPGMLQWDETYEVSIRRSGEDLIFKQLSGGEKMAAAIAIRMALLSQVSSNLRLLFLDEPTANMDDTRRNQLAEQITRLEGLNQLFVITHDDAFERSAHHVLQVYKDNDTSRVEIKG